jgi:hypothetical protein
MVLRDSQQGKTGLLTGCRSGSNGMFDTVTSLCPKSDEQTKLVLDKRVRCERAAATVKM